jgi:hypothetical protein
MEDCKMVFVDPDEFSRKEKLSIGYYIKPDPTNFVEREKKLKFMRDCYNENMQAIINLTHVLCRAGSLFDQKDMPILRSTYLLSVTAISDRMYNLKYLIRWDAAHGDSPYAQKISNDLATQVHLLEEINKVVEEEKSSVVTNKELSKQAEKNKNEILLKLGEVFEKLNEQYQPDIIKRLIDEGQLKQEPDKKTGKYITFKTPPDFFDWCFENGYEDKINAAFVAEYIQTNCSIETLKKYERDSRDITETKQKSRRIHRKRINPV